MGKLIIPPAQDENASQRPDIRWNPHTQHIAWPYGHSDRYWLITDTTTNPPPTWIKPVEHVTSWPPLTPSTTDEADQLRAECHDLHAEIEDLRAQLRAHHG